MGIRDYFKDGHLARMSNGTYCIIRDLGLVKGGKGLRHHECLLRLPRLLSKVLVVICAVKHPSGLRKAEYSHSLHGRHRRRV